MDVSPCFDLQRIIFWVGFPFYCFVAFLAGYISACKLATLRSFCGSSSQLLVASCGENRALPENDLLFWVLFR